MNRRTLMQICGLTVGGGVMGVGKAVMEQPVSTLTADLLTLSMSMDEAVDAIEQALAWPTGVVEGEGG